jgi:hypothetical protein
MKNHVAFAIVVAMAGAPLVGCATEDAEDVSVESEEVIGGADATPGARPWQAQLSIPGFSHWCGGSLVAPGWVLTAGHCVDGRTAGDFTVVMGEHNRTSNEGWEQTRTVTRIVRHPGFTSDLANDVALLRLSSPVTLNARVSTIALATGDDGAGWNAVVSGWGNTAPGSGASNVLQEASLPLRTNATCNAAPLLFRDLFASEVCAGFLAGDRGGCHGDSGGPLAVQRAGGNWDLVGVVSWGRGGTCNTFTVFARVSSHRAWILRTVRHDDIVWQHAGGQVHYWPIVNGVRTGGINIHTPVGADWTLRGVGDVNGDGNDDLVWQHAGGQVHYWPIVNGVRTGGINIHTPVGADWTLRAVGDMNGDGTDDLVWQHAGGQVHYWPIVNGVRTGGINIHTPVGSDWTLRATGDVNGDGTDDIVWQHAGGQVHYWPIVNGARTGGINIHTPVGSDWTLRGVGDVDADGTDDIVWQHAGGQVHYWPIVNGVRTGGINIHTPVGSDWTLRGVGSIDLN